MKYRTKTWNGEPAKYVQLKMDGHYTRIVTGPFGEVNVFTSHPTDITEKCRGYDWLRPHYARVPFDTVILGELYVPGHPASSVKTALKEQWDELQFSAFAVESMDPYAELEKVSEFCTYYGIHFLKWRRVINGDTVEALMEALPEDAEGYVLKDANLINWYKLKPANTIDLIISDFIDGEGKYDDTIGSIVCQTTEGHEVATVSGMTDQVRYEIGDSPHDYLGAVIEVKYQKIGSRGRLRHPRFVRFRDDKQPAECGIDQDPKLKEYWSD